MAIAKEINGSAVAKLEDEYADVRRRRPIVIRSALEMATSIHMAVWMLRPYLEKDCSVLVFGDLGTFKSFLTLLWALSAALLGYPVIYLSAEGKGMGKRIKGWAVDKFSDEWKEKLAQLPFFGIEQPLNLSADAVIEALLKSISDGAIEPALIVVDTLSKNSDGLAESSTEDATAYLNKIDRELRSRFKACVLLVHHTGHAAKDRARGPYALMANTDANFRIERPNPDSMTITITAGRMKDCEPPAPFSLIAKVVKTGDIDEDGKQVTTLILEPTETVAAKVVKRPTGKAQRAILAELERRQKAGPGLPVWTLDELRAIGKEIQISRTTVRDAIQGLIEIGFIKQTVGGQVLGYQL